MNLSPEQEQELKRMLKQVVWDYKIPEEELLEIFQGKRPGKALTRIQLHTKLLNSYNWYSLVRFFGVDAAKTFLTKEAISGLFPRMLKERYERARLILSA
jgi:hypothetical protein